MEFVIVTFGDAERPVFIDNQEQGLTGRRLSVPEGFHVFDLGTPLDYQPDFLELLVENTTPNEPMAIEFASIAARAAVRRRRARKRLAAAIRRQLTAKRPRRRAVRKPARRNTTKRARPARRAPTRKATKKTRTPRKTRKTRKTTRKTSASRRRAR